jgi:hypothetical protein
MKDTGAADGDIISMAASCFYSTPVRKYGFSYPRLTLSDHASFSMHNKPCFNKQLQQLEVSLRRSVIPHTGLVANNPANLSGDSHPVSYHQAVGKTPGVTVVHV